jgi:hypothetical protein
VTLVLTCCPQGLLKEKSAMRRSLFARGLKEVREALSSASGAVMAAEAAERDAACSLADATPKEAAADAAMRELLVRTSLLYAVCW